MEDRSAERFIAWKKMQSLGKALSSWYRLLKGDEAEPLKIVAREMIVQVERDYKAAFDRWWYLAQLEAGG